MIIHPLQYMTVLVIIIALGLLSSIILSTDQCEIINIDITNDLLKDLEMIHNVHNCSDTLYYWKNPNYKGYQLWCMQKECLGEFCKTEEVWIK